MPTLLAHGGTAGGAVEGALLLVPIVLFAFLTWRAKQGSKDPPDPGQEGGRR